MNPDHQAEAMSSRSSSHSHDSFADVDSLAAKFNTSTTATASTPEAFTDNQKQQQTEGKRSFSKARDNVTGIRLSLGSAMAAVKPKTIAKMAASAVQVGHTKSGQQSSLVASPSHLSVESSNPTFEVAQQEDHTMEVSGNPLWALAEAIQCDDVSNVFACVKQCESAEDFDRHKDNDSSDSSNNNKEVEEIFSMLRANRSARDIRCAALIISARFNRAAIVQAILADNAANGAEWSSEQAEALDIACSKGHVEIATLIACVDDGQMRSTLTLSLALRYYCLLGDVERARGVLMSDSPDVTIQAALLDACRHGRCDIVALLTADARFDPSDDCLQDARREACTNGHVEVVSMLLSVLPLSFEQNELRRALNIAADAGHCDVVALMVQDPRVNSGLGKSFALEQYCRVGDMKRAKEALDEVRSKTFNNHPLPGAILVAGSGNGHESIVKLLLTDLRVDPAADDNCAVIDAVMSGHVDIVKLLLAADPRVDPAADDNKAIQLASLRGHTSVVKLLLADTRVNPAANDNWAIRFASCGGHDSVVKLLLADPRVDPAADDNEAIQLASLHGHASVVKLLLVDPRVDPSARDNAAIGNASSGGSTSVVKLLLADPRVDPAANDNKAIRGAGFGGGANVVKLLLADARVDPAAKDNEALGSACYRGHIGVVKLLLADPRVDPSLGNPPALEVASMYGRDEVVQMLLVHPKVVVTKAALIAADKGRHGDIILPLLIDNEPRVLETMFESETPCKSAGALQRELRRREKASALALLLAVERTAPAVRISAVLREVVVEYSCFDLAEYQTYSDHEYDSESS